jgi:hypothetical protein
MKQCRVPTDFTLDLGYRKLNVKAGERYYTDEVADQMPEYVLGEDGETQAEKDAKEAAAEVLKDAVKDAAVDAAGPEHQPADEAPQRGRRSER